MNVNNRWSDKQQLKLTKKCGGKTVCYGKHHTAWCLIQVRKSAKKVKLLAAFFSSVHSSLHIIFVENSV